MPVKWTIGLTFSITTGVGSQASLIANSIADPGGSSSASAPYGYDIIAQAYGKYRVMASTIRSQWSIDQTANSAGLNNIWRTVIWPSITNGSFVSDINGAMQQPYSKHATGATGNTAGAQGFSPQINSYMSTEKIFGERRATIAAGHDYAAVIAANPANLWYWNILVTAQNPTASLTTAISGTIDLIQYVQFSRRSSLAST